MNAEQTKNKMTEPIRSFTSMAERNFRCRLRNKLKDKPRYQYVDKETLEVFKNSLPLQERVRNTVHVSWESIESVYDDDDKSWGAIMAFEHEILSYLRRVVESPNDERKAFLINPTLEVHWDGETGRWHMWVSLQFWHTVSLHGDSAPVIPGLQGMHLKCEVIKTQQSGLRRLFRLGNRYEIAIKDEHRNEPRKITVDADSLYWDGDDVYVTATAVEYPVDDEPMLLEVEQVGEDKRARFRVPAESVLQCTGEHKT